jgi:hypothetical protein
VDGLRFLHAQRPAGELYAVVPVPPGDPVPTAPRPSAAVELEGRHGALGSSAADAADAAPTAAAAKDSSPTAAPEPPPPAPRWAEEEVAWPSPLYPFLLVSFGSGVSVLQVNSAADDDFERVGGTATGGATFLGLMHLLTNQPHLSFDAAVALAAKGDAANVDKLVGDIYGADG